MLAEWRARARNSLPPYPQSRDSTSRCATAPMPASRHWPSFNSGCGNSGRGQEADRIHRLAVAADLEMQLHPVGIARAHLRDALALGHVLTFLHQQLVVVRVDAEERVVVLDHDELAEAAYAGTTEDHPPRRAGQHRLTQLAGNA